MKESHSLIEKLKSCRKHPTFWCSRPRSITLISSALLRPPSYKPPGPSALITCPVGHTEVGGWPLVNSDSVCPFPRWTTSVCPVNTLCVTLFRVFQCCYQTFGRFVGSPTTPGWKEWTRIYRLCGGDASTEGQERFDLSSRVATF